MIVLAIIFILASLYFLWDYRQDPKLYKFRIIPVIAICFFGTTEYFQALDERLKLSLLVVAILITANIAYEYYRDFKVVSFREKKRLRDEREESRKEQSDKILEEIYELKHGLRKATVRSQEINMDFQVTDYKEVKQLTVFGDYIDFEELSDKDNIDFGPNVSVQEIAVNHEAQLEMFHVEHITESK